MNKRIFVIEDDVAIARLLWDNLQYEGFAVKGSQTGLGAVQEVKQFKPDLVLLDLMLPNGFDGLEICRQLSQQPERTPVIIISAKSQKNDRIRGLTLGADDYVCKPFALEELLARVYAVLRRTSRGSRCCGWATSPWTSSG